MREEGVIPFTGKGKHGEKQKTEVRLFKKQLPEKSGWKPLPRVLSVENIKRTF